MRPSNREATRAAIFMSLAPEYCSFFLSLARLPPSEFFVLFVSSFVRSNRAALSGATKRGTAALDSLLQSENRKVKGNVSSRNFGLYYNLFYGVGKQKRLTD